MPRMEIAAMLGVSGLILYIIRLASRIESYLAFLVSHGWWPQRNIHWQIGLAWEV